MPEYAAAQQNLNAIKTQYDAEMKRVEDEFNKKYEEFLDGQKNFAPSILNKRHAELQELLNKNKAFKEKANQLLEQAKEDAYKPLRDKLSEILKGIGDAKGYAFILNTDGFAVPYISGAVGEDVTPLIKSSLQ